MHIGILIKRRVRWKYALSEPFLCGNGTRQGSILSPYLFTRYIRELICDVASCMVGCCIAGTFYNVLAYADDLVLLAPSWRGLQALISRMNGLAKLINMSCNVLKTVCMVFQPRCRIKRVANDFPCFKLDDVPLPFVKEFKYLGHMINNCFNDNDDIMRVIKCLYTRSNILLRRYSKCSVNVKIKLFTAFCLSFYDVGIWRFYSTTVFNKLRACYYKCIKLFFGYDRRYSVTLMLEELGFSNFDVFMEKEVYRTSHRWASCTNCLVQQLAKFDL